MSGDAHASIWTSVRVGDADITDGVPRLHGQVGVNLRAKKNDHIFSPTSLRPQQEWKIFGARGTQRTRKGSSHP